MNNRLIIISNRLPFKIFRSEGDGFDFVESVGGLATGLGSFYKEYDGRWIGWPGLDSDEITAEERDEIASRLGKENCVPVFVDDDDFRGYYNNFSNAAIWPLFHYFSQNAVFDADHWESYRKVNRQFAEEAAKVLKPDDGVWIHDYHLMLLPQILREKFPKLKIGFFLHIPFPSSEIFRQIPWRREILEGLLGADLLGFHTYDYARHFLSAVRRIMGFEHAYGRIKTNRNMVKVDVFPIGVDYEKFNKSSKIPEVAAEAKKFRRESEDRKVILTIDRLDYTKGIPSRLRAFDRFLEKYPEYLEKVSLIMVSAPSRTDVRSYQNLKREVEELVGSINGKYGKIGWTPVNYFYRSVPFTTIASLYHLADTTMVTPIWDGMNLVAKEFVAAKADKKGALVLSETAGASQELTEAIIVNPNNREEVADAIKTALETNDKDRRDAMSMMQSRLKRYDIHHWAEDFLRELDSISEEQRTYVSKYINPKIESEILDNYAAAAKRLFLLDYDGTLMRFHKKPEQAKPDREILETLRRLSTNSKNDVYIISGRDKATLEEWFGKADINLIAEHGAWIRYTGEDWNTIIPLSDEWKDEMRHIFELFTDRTPGSFYEEKEFSLVWHYRKVNPNFASVRVNELKEALVQMTSNMDLGVLYGNKVVEVKNLYVNKGSAAAKAFEREKYDFVLAAGDDATDEDSFKSLPPEAYTLKVGYFPSRARYNIVSVGKLREFLSKFE